MPGRDTSKATQIADGAARVFYSLGFVTLFEFTLANHRRADLCCLGPKGQITIVEVKSSVADFKSDEKWPEYAPYCDEFYFAVGQDFPQELIPNEVGLIIADAFGGAVIRTPEPHILKAARRKAVTLKFARMAAERHMRVDVNTIAN